MTLRDHLRSIRALQAREEGQTMAEYGILLGTVTAGTVAALITLKLGTLDLFQRIIDALNGIL